MWAWLAAAAWADADALRARLAELETLPDARLTEAAWRQVADELAESMKTVGEVHQDPTLMFRTYATLGRAAELGDSDDREVRTVHANRGLREAAFLAREDPRLLRWVPRTWRDRLEHAGIVGRAEVWLVVLDLGTQPSSIGSTELRVVARDGPLVALVSRGHVPPTAWVYWTEGEAWQACIGARSVPAGCGQAAVERHAGVNPWGPGVVRAVGARTVPDGAVEAFIEGLWASEAVTEAWAAP